MDLIFGALLDIGKGIVSLLPSLQGLGQGLVYLTILRGVYKLIKGPAEFGSTIRALDGRRLERVWKRKREAEASQDQHIVVATAAHSHSQLSHLSDPHLLD